MSIVLYLGKVVRFVYNINQKIPTQVYKESRRNLQIRKV